MFTPRKVNGLEPKIREFCANALDPLVGSGRFDFVADLGAVMPMQVISALLGIPEGDQEMIRDHANAQMRTEAGKPMKQSEDGFVTGEIFEAYIDWRADHPSDDIMTELLNAEFVDETGTARHADSPGAADLSQRGGGRGERNHHAADRLGGQGFGRASRSAP